MLLSTQNLQSYQKNFAVSGQLLVMLSKENLITLVIISMG